MSETRKERQRTSQQANQTRERRQKHTALKSIRDSFFSLDIHRFSSSFLFPSACIHNICESNCPSAGILGQYFFPFPFLRSQQKSYSRLSRTEKKENESNDLSSFSFGWSIVVFFSIDRAIVRTLAKERRKEIQSDTSILSIESSLTCNRSHLFSSKYRRMRTRQISFTFQFIDSSLLDQ